ncbi:hypothetical protein M9458_044784, partial [Cirrhinus mrigala]
PPSVIAAAEAEMKSVSVMEGDPVTLYVPQLQRNELIVWWFGDEGKLIAKHDMEAKTIIQIETRPSDWISDHHEQQNHRLWTLYSKDQQQQTDFIQQIHCYCQ